MQILRHEIYYRKVLNYYRCEVLIVLIHIFTRTSFMYIQSVTEVKYKNTSRNSRNRNSRNLRKLNNTIVF